MEQLWKLFYRLIAETDLTFKRYLYDQIDWRDRLIIIKGAKGVGKSTLICQHIKEHFGDSIDKALYVSLDHIWFTNHSILDMAEYHYAHGGTHLFLDEVHKYHNWQQEVKNIYDYYPKLHIVVTGSSMLRIDSLAKVDLSRRHVAYTLDGLSFREFLIMEGYADLGTYQLDDILQRHGYIASTIAADIKVLPLFERYLKEGYYPFYKESPSTFAIKLQQAIINVIEADIPAVSEIEYESIYKIKQLLSILSQQSPYTLNITQICRELSVSRNTLVRLIDLLDTASIIRRLYPTLTGLKQLTKPEKLLFDNTNIMYAFAQAANDGTMRETFASSQLSHSHSLTMPTKGDLLVDQRHLFEIGGKGKGFKQIKDINDSYVLAADIEIGAGNKIPLWLLGLLY